MHRRFNFVYQDGLGPFIGALEKLFSRRHPDSSTAPKQFRLATIVVTRERLLNDEEMALLDYFAARGEATAPLPFSSGFAKGMTKPFAVASRGLGSLITALSSP